MKNFSLSLFFAFIFSPIGAQPFSLNETWNVGDYNAYNARITGMLIQDDGKVVFWGRTTPTNWQAVARFYLESMLIDSDFYVQAQSAPTDMQKLPDGGFINNGGNWVTKTDEIFYGDTAYNSMFKATSQQPGTGTKNGGLRMFVYPDGRVLAGCGNPCLGLWYKPTEHQSPFRILPNGMVDSSFTTTSNGGVFMIVPYNDTKLILSGFFTEYEGFSSLGLVRIDTSGALDSTFQSPFIMPTIAVAYQEGIHNDGRILVLGNLYLPENDTIYSLIRLLPDGKIDPTFNKLQHGPSSTVDRIFQTPDGGYIIAGKYTTEIHGQARGHIAKLDAYGNLEEEYFKGQGFSNNLEETLSVSINRIVYHEPEDHYYVMGFFQNYDGEPVPSVVRFKGLLTSTSNPASESNPFTFHPNPATESISIQLPENTTGQQNVQVEILNQLGQRVLYQKLDITSVSIGHLPAGIYFVNLQSDGLVFQPQKLVVY